MHTRRPDVQADLGFASQRWRNFVVRPRPEIVVDRRALEVCVFIYLVDALQIGDLSLWAQLLPWSQCKLWLSADCAILGIPERGRRLWDAEGL